MSQTFLQEDRKNKIRRGEPIELLGLTFYPITMRYYERFLACSTALILRQAAFPVKYAVKDYMSAIWTLEIDSIQERGIKFGLFESLINLLFLSLRIEMDFNEFMRSNIALKEEQNEINIDHIHITQNGKSVDIKPIDFSLKIRPLLAEQNGLDLPKEFENLDLVNDADELKRRNQAKQKLNHNIDDLIASVAYLSHVDEKEIDDWTIKQFEARKRAIERAYHYSMYGQAEMSGMVKFEKGNPYPSWCFDVIDDSMGTVEMDKLGKIFGESEK